MMDEKEYRWKMFKMTWLVPNWKRARGPAWWVWNLIEWWDYNIADKENCCGLRHKCGEWWDEKAVKWLTPWLKNARKLHSLCIEDNGTKLLHFKANYFYIRTRDEHQWYFEGKTSLTGKTEIWMTQWLSKDGKPTNLFMWGLCNGILDGKQREEAPVENKQLVFSGRVLTKKQLEEARAKVLKIEEFGWDWKSIREDELYEEIYKKEPKKDWKEYKGFRDSLEDAMLKKLFPDREVKEWWELETKDVDLFLAEYKELTVEKVKEIIKHG